VSGFHTATICADCDPPVVAISTGNGSRCPRCWQVVTWPSSTTAISERLDGALARDIIRDTAVRSDGDARLLAELALRLLERLGKEAGHEARVMELEDELTDLRDLADLVRDADISALPPEILEVRQRWLAENHAKEVAEEASAPPACPHCAAGEPSVWDPDLFHYAHPHPEDNKLKFCHEPWRERCRRCSGTVGACPCGSTENVTR
jgi:hypothetical protein